MRLFRDVWKARQIPVASGNPWRDDEGQFASPDGASWNDIADPALRESLFHAAWNVSPIRRAFYRRPESVTDPIEALIQAGKFEEARRAVRDVYGIDVLPDLARAEFLRVEQAVPAAYAAFSERFATRNPFHEQEMLVGDGKTTPMGAIVLGTHATHDRYDDSPPAVYLASLRAVTPGGGGTTLRALLEVADEFGVDVSIYAKTFGDSEHRKSQKQLVQWYREWGFVDDVNGVEDDDDAEGSGRMMLRRPGTPMRAQKTTRARRPRRVRKGQITDPAILAVLRIAPPHRPWPRRATRKAMTIPVASGNPYRDTRMRFASRAGLPDALTSLELSSMPALVSANTLSPPDAFAYFLDTFQQSLQRGLRNASALHKDAISAQKAYVTPDDARALLAVHARGRFSMSSTGGVINDLLQGIVDGRRTGTTVEALLNAVYPFHTYLNTLLRTRGRLSHKPDWMDAQEEYDQPVERDELRQAAAWRDTMAVLFDRFGVTVSEDIVVRRGISEKDAAQKLLASKMSRFLDLGFVSTSVNDGAGMFAYAGQMFIRIPKGTRVLPLSIDDLGEVVLPPRSVFRVHRDQQARPVVVSSYGTRHYVLSMEGTH
jgi:hypothetical protein